ncbi:MULTISPECIES: protein-glutamate O-methyltransferase CheR [unclassified Beijerinckia]|uniref:CheR family methyltransferase n=1 Tax=unclassified Beijerinckia TaxID=2638183 RepID=UPI00089AE5FF|nr:MULTISPECIES: protein-glutamate O-methyltransferase CheR [unclassified Beijerinckia]MDH7799556.1 chemotaxis protein methyltransferase CheR [Beijerinckia sp. GAS462]SEB46601.1 chemotaxis protein methyltransferase CheR [Beijerinckia sp. 28-YEA-48]
MNDRIEQLRAFLQTSTGLALERDQRQAIEQRLSPVAARFGIAQVEDLIDRHLQQRDPQLSAAVVDAMMTNETFFFRDRKPFELFQQVILPRLLERKQERRLRIWSAACATGQEPYSLAMMVEEAAHSLTGWSVEIVASDISASALEIARDGLYNQFEMQRGLPIASLLRHFQPDRDKWRIAEHLRARVQFQQINLINDFTRLGTFDVIFCRNVLMYFDQATRKAVLARLARSLEPDGILMLGATEFTPGDSPFAPMAESPALLQLRAPVSEAQRNHLAIA